MRVTRRELLSLVLVAVGTTLTALANRDEPLLALACGTIAVVAVVTIGYRWWKVRG